MFLTDITRSVSAKDSSQLAKQLATKNHAQVLADPNGARCYQCLGKPIITKSTPTCDGSTLFCPLCRIDAVVPASQIPKPVEKTLQKWYRHWFSTSYCDSEDEKELEEDEKEVKLQNKVPLFEQKPFHLILEEFPGL